MALKTGKVILAKNIKLDKDYKNVLDYTESEMLSLINSNAVVTVNNCSFIREQNKIEVPASYGNCLKCNYLAFQNPDYSNKWFFAFITDIEYRNDENTRISFEIDDFATWFDYWNPKTCWIIREHVSHDGYHEWLTDEGLPVSDYINYSMLEFNYAPSECHPVMMSSVSPVDGSDVSGGVYGGIYSGANQYVFKNTTALNDGLDRIASAGKSDGIVGIYILPDWLTGYSSVTWSSNNIARVFDTDGVTMDLPIGLGLQPSSIDGYVPKNKKCFNSPYIFYTISNNSGNEVELRLEDFKDNNDHLGKLKIYGTCTPGGSIRCVPVDYKVGKNTPLSWGENNDYGINCGKFPICSYAVDMYTNWLTQNSVNNTMQTIGGIAGVIGGGAMALTGVGTMAGIGAIGTGGSLLLNQFKANRQADMIPNDVRGNTNAGDVTYTAGKLGFTVFRRESRAEFIEQIDNFFTRYGYKINKLKEPNMTSRTYFNYIQIGDSEDIGYSTNENMSVPPKSMEKINNIFRRGVTIWHNHTHVGNYAVDNSLN